jgi:WD40 repeat protein
VVHCPDGRSFATISGFHAFLSNATSPDPTRVQAVTIWNAKTGQKIRTLANPTAGPYHDVAFDSGFERIAWAKHDGTVEIRDATTSRLVRCLSGHGDLVALVAFSPDGQRLASASRDGTVRVGC